MAILTRKISRPMLVAMAALALFAMCAPAWSEDASPVQMFEQKIKAGLIYNFLKYTNWPRGRAASNGHIKVCLLGGDPFDGYLYPLQGKTAQQYMIDIMETSTLSDYDGCNLVFINRNRESDLPAILQALKGKSILTVSDIDDFSRQGGMVEFSMQNDQHIHLYINKAAIDSSGLFLQDRLLKLAEVRS